MLNIARALRLSFIFFFALYSIFCILPSPAAHAAGSGYITASGGGTKTAGSNFTVTVYAGGTTFDSLQGKISVVGPVSIVSFYGGSATWLPGKSPANGAQFVGITSSRSYLTVATITLRGSSNGSGYVSVSGVRLANSGSEVGTTGGSTSFTIVPAPTPPGTVSVSSSSHPDQKAEYEDSLVKLSWKAPSNGAEGYSYGFDQKADAIPPTKINTTDTKIEFKDVKVGTHYFHIRAKNADGWGPTTHYKVTVVPKTDASLAVPAVTEIKLTDDHSNNLEKGTVTGIVLSGTGPVGYTLELTITPGWQLDKKKYPAIIINETGSWQLTVNDPIKAGYYQVVARAKKDSKATANSSTVMFELSVKNGGEITLVSSGDETSAYQAAAASQAELVAGQQQRNRVIGIAGLVVLILVFTVLFFLKRELLARAKA
jgi:hypothetical protein